MLIRQPAVIGGSGSSYLYGHFDLNYKANMTKDEAVQFVSTCKLSDKALLTVILLLFCLCMRLRYIITTILPIVRCISFQFFCSAFMTVFPLVIITTYCVPSSCRCWLGDKQRWLKWWLYPTWYYQRRWHWTHTYQGRPSAHVFIQTLITIV